MNLKWLRSAVSVMTALSLTLSFSAGAFAQPHSDADDIETATPIKHVVVIFQENVSFDHYFATYPYASGFEAKPGTPSVNNLLSGGLLTNNPNTTQPFLLSRTEAVTCDQDHNYNDEQTAFNHGAMDNFVKTLGAGNGALPSPLPTLAPGSAPYAAGQLGGSLFLPNQFYQKSSTAYSGYCFDAGPANETTANKGIVMGYYDGTTVTAFWQYAQHFAMSDNSYSTTFGPSAPGAVNLVAGDNSDFTANATSPNGSAASPAGDIWGGKGSPAAFTGSLIGDARPFYDDCVNTNSQLQTTVQAYKNETPGVPANVGDLMGDLTFTSPEHPVTWGWFMGGFAPTNGTILPAVCGSAHTGIAGFGPAPLPDNVTTVGDYIPHHQPFEFYKSTSNPHHLRPTKESMIGKTDQANHQYDLTDFFTALKDGNLPAVSYLKASAYQDGHAGYSDPLDEQNFVVATVNAIMGSDDWKDTAIIIAYDDSDGWYDHAMDPLVNQSGITGGADDQLTAAGFCGTATPAPAIQGRCGYGPRQPLIVISPYAKENYVDHSISDQSSILRFIEDNWDLGRIAGSNDAKAGSLMNMFDFDEDHNHDRERDGNDRRLLLNPITGHIEFGGDNH